MRKAAHAYGCWRSHLLLIPKFKLGRSILHSVGVSASEGHQAAVTSAPREEETSSLGLRGENRCADLEQAAPVWKLVESWRQRTICMTS